MLCTADSILSAGMMLDHVSENVKADAIREAVAKVVAGGNGRTYDMSKLPGGQGVGDRGAATTMAMTDAIIAEFER